MSMLLSGVSIYVDIDMSTKQVSGRNEKGKRRDKILNEILTTKVRPSCLLSIKRQGAILNIKEFDY